MAREWNAEIYDRVNAPMTERGLELVDTLDLDGDETVLDAGCGTGAVTARLLERLPEGRVVALDGSRKMLDRAAERLGHDPRVTFLQADLAQPIPYDGLVDAIVSTSTFHWITDHRALFAHLAAILRPGGTLTAEYGGHGNLENIYRHVRDLGMDEEGKHYATVEEELEALELAGYTEARADLVPRPATIPADYLELFLRNVTLSGAEYSDEFVGEVARRMNGPELDYVRMVVSALRVPEPLTGDFS